MTYHETENYVSKHSETNTLKSYTVFKLFVYRFCAFEPNKCRVSSKSKDTLHPCKYYS